jgi:hypothetical protein
VSANTISIAIHVRRGDVTYLDRYSKPSSRWVQTVDMLDVLRGVRTVLGTPLEPPAVQVHLYSESRGWYANDTAALHEVAPRATVYLDSSPSATIDALISMSRADILLMGTSGFSTWSAIFSCGVKIGPRHHPMMPMRHVSHSNTLTARAGSFASTIPQLRRVWEEYSACKTDAACRPTLCAPRHLSSPLWAASGLAQEAIGRPSDAQWHVPSSWLGTSEAGAAPPLASVGDGSATQVSGWIAARESCTHHKGVPLKATSPQHIACVRSTWSRNVSTALSLKRRLAVAAGAANSSSQGSALPKAPRPMPGRGTSSSPIGPPGATVTSARVMAPAAALQPTTTVQREGRTFLVWASSQAAKPKRR